MFALPVSERDRPRKGVFQFEKLNYLSKDLLQRIISRCANCVNVPVIESGPGVLPLNWLTDPEVKKSGHRGPLLSTDDPVGITPGR